jgi:hypothetical protein
MTDRVAERLDADIILPASSVKPEYKGKTPLRKWLTGFPGSCRIGQGNAQELVSRCRGEKHPAGVGIALPPVKQISGWGRRA